MNPIHVQIDEPNGCCLLGNDLPIRFIIGPNMIESREHARMMAAMISQLAKELGIFVIFKASFDKANRSSESGARGVGMKAGLPILAEIRDTWRMPILTDVHLPGQCDPVAEVADIIQIPAFLCRQTDLLFAAGQTGKPVNIKKGQFVAPSDMANAARKIAVAGSHNKIMLCERGTSFGYHNLVVDMRALPIMAQTGYPVIMDATHAATMPGALGDKSGGERWAGPVLAKAAAAVGVAAMFLETHNDPDNAPCEGQTMLSIFELPNLIKMIVAIDRIVKGKENT